LKVKFEAVERREAERRAIDERKRNEEVGKDRVALMYFQLDFLRHQGQHLETFLKGVERSG
jgi:hypothetical protein